MCVIEQNLDLALIWSAHAARRRGLDPGEYVADAYEALRSAETDHQHQRSRLRTWAQRKVRWAIASANATENRRWRRRRREFEDIPIESPDGVESRDYLDWLVSRFEGRCRQIVLGLAAGLQQVQIARRLGVSESTVSHDIKDFIRPALAECEAAA